MLSIEEKRDLSKKAEILIEAANYEGGECGEWWALISQSMINIIYRYEASDELISIIVKEFNETYELFLEECEFVEETVIFEKKIKTLKWKYEN